LFSERMKWTDDHEDDALLFARFRLLRLRHESKA
jgi:hypothetical protein